MPIELTTPAEGGIIASGSTFTHAKISNWNHDSNPGSIHLTIVFGELDEEENFIRSSNRQMRKFIEIKGQDYIDLVSGATSSAAGENIYAAVKDALYQWLMTNDPALAGTVV